MNQRQLASVLFAALGVFMAASRIPDLFIHSALLAPFVIAHEDAGAPIDQRSFAVVGLLGAFLAVGLGFALVVLRDRLAQRLFPASSGPLASREFQAVAFSVLGLFFAVQGLARLGWARPFDWAGATELALGVGLFFGARGLARVWSMARSAGSPRSEGAV